MKKGSKTPPWFRMRGYPHFDHRVQCQVASDYVSNSTAVARHAFFPFLSYPLITPRYKRDKGKVEDKVRPIRYAAHLDSHIFAYYSYLLSEQYEARVEGTHLSENVIAYRSLGKSNIEFADEAFLKIQELGPCVVLCFDIVSFFDDLDHALIKKQWCDVMGCDSLPPDHFAVFKAVTRYAWVDRSEAYRRLGITKKAAARMKGALCTAEVFRSEIRKAGLINKHTEAKGVPQGSPISAVLSNLFMMRFDKTISELAGELDGVYRRYCDDILFACPIDSEAYASTVIDQEIQKLGLRINHDKTEKTYFERDAEGRLVALKPMQYLGFKFDGRRKYLRSKTMSRFWRRAKSGVRSAAKAAKAAGKKGGDGSIFKQGLYEKFTHFGKNNFIKYAYRASARMNEPLIRGQVKNHFKKVIAEIGKNTD